MFGGFVVFFRCLSFLGYRFSGSFVVLFSGLGFLRSGGFGFCFLVFLAAWAFWAAAGLASAFLCFWQPELSALQLVWPRLYGVFVMGRLGSSAVGSSWRLSGAYCVSSESGGRETHSSGNDQS